MHKTGKINRIPVITLLILELINFLFNTIVPIEGKGGGMKPNRVKQKFIKPTLAVGRSNSMPVKALAVPIACFVFTFVFLLQVSQKPSLPKGQ